ncbi:MAG: glycosyltransferase [Myxococcales bacterium]
MPKFELISVIVPARNEECYIRPCLSAIRDAASHVSIPVETVVVLNRCTDATEQIALESGARTVSDGSRCLARVRNQGAQACRGDIIVTCDADSRVHPLMLARVLAELANGAVGGGVDVRIDRRSRGIAFTEALLHLSMLLTRVSAGAFWTTRETFERVGGFNEAMLMGEDYEFARRLRTWGKGRAAPFVTLWDTPLLTSARKFDRYGDWLFLRMLLLDVWRIRRSINGTSREFVDEFFYEFDHGKEPPHRHEPL